MSIVKFEQDRQPPDLPPERLDLRIYYEGLVAHTLLSILRQRRFIALLVTVALALALLAIPLMPRKYSAEALIYPDLLSNEQGKGVPVASSDASSIVNGETRLILSDAIVTAVVKRLGMDRDLETTRSHGWGAQAVDWLRDTFLPETHNDSSLDRAVAALRNRVGIMKDPRAYFISISFAARSPDEAARVVNGFALEYVRAKSMQQRAAAVTAAERDLRRQRAIYGDKHPKVLQAEDELAAARAVQKAILNSEDGHLGDLVSEETVKLAIPNRTPTSPKGSMILGLTFALSLLAGMGLAVWRDRSGFSHGNSKGRRPGSRGNRRGKKGSSKRGARRKSPLLKIWTETTDAARVRIGHVVARLPGRSLVRYRMDNARSTLAAAISSGHQRLLGPPSPGPRRPWQSFGGTWMRRMTNRVDSSPGDGGHVLGQRSATLVNQCIVSGGSFLLNVLLARALAASDYGEFALFLGGVFALRQVDASLVSFPLSVRLSLESENDRAVLLGKTALLSALLNLVLVSVMAAGIALLGAREILLPACLCFLCWQAQETSRRCLFAEFRYREAVIGDGLAYMGQVILVAALLWLHSITLSSALYVIAAAFAMGAVAHTARLRFVWPTFSVVGRELRVLALEYLSVGKWILASYQLRLVRGQLIPWMLAVVAGTAATASFQAALNIANTMNPIILGVANAIPQSAAHAYRSGGVRGAVRMSYGYALFGLCPILAICAACVIMPNLLLQTVYGHASPYLAAAVGLQVLVVAGVLDYVAEVVGLTLLGINSGKLAFAVNLLALLAALVLAAAFIGPLGILGACVALVGANLMRVIAGLIAIVWRIDRQSSCELGIAIGDDTQRPEQRASAAAEEEGVSREAALRA